MDLIFSLLIFYGKSCIFVLIDHLTNYLLSLAIYILYIDPQEGKFIFGLHGISMTNISDGDSHFFYGFGQVFFYSWYAQLTHSSIYYFLEDEKT